MSYGPYSPETQAPKQNAWGALVRVITEPAATIRDFEGRVPIFPGYLVSMLFMLVATLMRLPAALKVSDQVNAANPMMTPQLATVTHWVSIFSAVFVSLVAPWIGGLLVSLFAIFFGQFQEQRVGYPSYLGMVGYARVPLAIGQVVNGALTLTLADKVKGFSLSLAVLAPDSAGTVVQSLLAMFTPFSVWYFALLAIGFGALHRTKWSKGMGMVLTIFIILAILTAGVAAVSSKLVSALVSR